MRKDKQQQDSTAPQIHARLARRLGAEAEKQNLTEDELIAEMEADRQAVYNKTFGEKSKEDDGKDIPPAE